MKLLKTFILLSTLAILSSGYGQSEPDKKTTLAYITKIFNETSGYEYIHGGVVYKITSIEFKYTDYYYSPSYYYVYNSMREDNFSFGQLAPSGYCTFAYVYNNINWAKMKSISDATGTTSNSPVKLLAINFTPNSILRTGHTDYKCTTVEGFKFNGETQSVSFILFPYRDEEGVKERLTKAINHLSKLAKEEQAKNDPFAN